MRRIQHARVHSPEATLRRIVQTTIETAVTALSENSYKFTDHEKQVLRRKYGISVQSAAREKFASLFTG